MNSVIQRNSYRLQETKTTGSTGNIAIGNGDRTVIGAYSNGYIILPFVSNDGWFLKVVDYTSLLPVANTEITYTVEFI